MQNIFILRGSSGVAIFGGCYRNNATEGVAAYPRWAAFTLRASFLGLRLVKNK